MIEAAAIAALNHLLGQADWARARLAPFAGRHAEVAMPPWRLRLRIDDDGSFASAEAGAVPDVEVALPAEAPFLAAQGGEKLMQAARISGPAQFASELGYVLKNLRWDFEEDLSRFIGDIAAHRVAQTLGLFGQWQKRTAERAAAGFARYATETNPMLAKRSELHEMTTGVGELQGSVALAERRLDALTTRRRQP
ncbi:MAG TPA: hypothetical protein VF816_00845 [Rhodocyclaceae bacterium]